MIVLNCWLFSIVGYNSNKTLALSICLAVHLVFDLNNRYRLLANNCLWVSPLLRSSGVFRAPFSQASLIALFSSSIIFPIAIEYVPLALPLILVFEHETYR